MNMTGEDCGRGIAGFFTRLVVDVIDVFGMLWNWFAGRFKWSPMRLFAAAIIGLVYLVSPIDIVPDVIPFAGWIDDILVVTAVVRLARFDLARYRRWREKAELK